MKKSFRNGADVAGMGRVTSTVERSVGNFPDSATMKPRAITANQPVMRGFDRMHGTPSPEGGR
jgi:hypothetical protein